MVDEKEVLKQYSYKATSNLVLEQDRGSRRGRPDDTGEVTALRANELEGKMGDKASRPGEKSAEVVERKERRRMRVLKARAADAAQKTAPALMHGGGRRGRPVLDADVLANDVSVVDIADELELTAGARGYVPTTRVSQVAFEALLGFVTTKLGDQPPDLLRSAVDETLAVLKDQRLQEKERKRQIEDMLSIKMSEDEFSRLSTLGRKIKDFGDDEDQTIEGLAGSFDGQDGAEQQVVPVLFEDEDVDTGNASGDDEVNVVEEVVDIKEDDIQLRDEDDRERSLAEQAENQFGAGAAIEEQFDPVKVDGYWLQRRLGQHYEDPQDCQEKAKEVFDILSSNDTDPACENKLVALLAFDKLDFIHLVIENRTAVVYCTRLARSEGPDERQAIKAEMEESEKGRDLLLALANDKNTNGSLVQGNETVVPRSGQGSPTRKRPRKAVRFEGDEPGGHARDEVEVERNSRKYMLRKLDLEDLAFERGGRLITVRDVKLPTGSEHTQHKDYEEWHIPPAKSPDHVGMKETIPISSLPEWFQAAFSGTRRLNQMQSDVFPCAFGSDENMLLCAPTGAGKTNVAMLTILRAVQNSSGKGQEMTGVDEADLSGFKVVYVAPMKALVSEVVGNLGTRLSELGISVRELTGDVNLSKQEIEETQVIVTTPEKWDIITRKSGERAFTSLVRLLIVDEIHLLHDERGPVLEAIVARTCRSVDSLTATTRIVGLSATLPNYKDVATFMRVKLDSGLFFFDSSHRPCPLQQCYVGVTGKKALKRFQLMNDLTFEKVKEQVLAGQQVIVFVHSRKETLSTCEYLIEKAIDEEVIDKFMKTGSNSHKIIEAELSSINAKKVANVLEHGFATHHAGMTRDDRHLVEALFEGGHIRVLISTATLAWGVNLPAHAVIIKGTQVYAPEHGRWVQLSSMDVMQMMGRAGRPQFDEHGKGIIITTKADVLYYLSLLNDQLPIESQLISRIVDMLNAEVAMGTVASIDEGALWLSYTYLYVRMLKHPVLYGIPVDEHQLDPALQRRRAELVHAAAKRLHGSGLVRYDSKSGSICGTDLGRVAADFYVGHETISLYVDHMKSTATDIDLLHTFSLSGEFRHIRVREEEKLELSRLAERTPIPIKESLDEPTAKVNVLLQAYISRLSLDGLALRADMVYVTQSAARLCRALLHVAIQLKRAMLVEKCLKLCKAVDARQWSAQTPLRQFPGEVGEDALYKIERKDISFERYYDLTVAELGELLRNQKLGRTAHRLVHSLPRLELDAEVRPISRSVLEIELTLSPDFRFDRKFHGSGEAFWVMVEDSDSEFVLHSELFFLRGSLSTEDHVLNITVQLTSPQPPQYFIRCMSDKWIVPDTVYPVSLRNLLLPEKFAAHTKLLDLRPLSVETAFQVSSTAKEDDGILELDAYREALQATRDYFLIRCTQLSAVQTQLFPTLFESDVNTVIATLPGRDRTACAEFSLARLFCRNPTAVAVWVVGRGQIAVDGVRELLETGIAKALNLTVGSFLTDRTKDMNLLRTPGTVVVTTSERWDMFSRKWRQKREGKLLRRIGLLIVDGVHLISEGDGRGAALEVVASRMRHIAVAESGKGSLRIVALSDPVSNARELGQWLGCPPSAVLSFHSKAVDKMLSVEVVPCVQRRGGVHYSPASNMVRPVFAAIQRHIGEKSTSALVFVPTRKMARSLALELVAIAAQGGQDDRFLHGDIEKQIESMKVGSLRECMGFGVAYTHEDLSKADRIVVEELFSSGDVQVLVAVSGYAWQTVVSRPCIVIIAGTARVDEGGLAVRRAEYLRTDLLRMICTSRTEAPSDKRVAVVITDSALYQHYKERCMEPFPVESQLRKSLSDHMNAEIAAGVIESKQDAVDYLTWTFFYRRLPKNPNYYGMKGFSHQEISAQLSEMVDTSLSELEASKCLAAEGDEDVALGTLNLGIIAAHYYIRPTTVELFASSMTPKTKIRGLVDILSLASEFDTLAVRIGEEELLRTISEDLPIPIDDTGSLSYSNPHVKVHVLLQAHLSRVKLPGELAKDQADLLPVAVRLMRAMVDVISSAGWLKPALSAVELSQILVQGMWDSDSPLMQLPFVDKKMASTLQTEHDVSDIFGFLEMDQKDRAAVLSHLSKQQVLEIAAACQEFPDMGDIEIVSIQESHDDDGQSQMRVILQISRNDEDEDSGDDDHRSPGRGAVPVVTAPRYPEPKEEGWWVIIGDVETNSLLTLKHVSVKESATVKLDFISPPTLGRHKLQLYLLSDSYVDCDQEEAFDIDVTAVADEDDEEVEAAPAE